jgi:hypothetical protein
LARCAASTAISVSGTSCSGYSCYSIKLQRSLSVRCAPLCCRLLSPSDPSSTNNTLPLVHEPPHAAPRTHSKVQDMQEVLGGTSICDEHGNRRDQYVV